ncbi:MAG: hypothetical protein R3C05_25160 [Pirellulaceae bacterium]
MDMKITQRLSRLLLTGCLAFMLLNISVAGDCQCGMCKEHCACCTLKCEPVDAKAYDWEVEYKQVCIPKVVFPWQKNRCNPCVNNGACVRCVRVLKEVERKTKELKYTWTPHMIGGYGTCGCRCRNHRSGCCLGRSCHDKCDCGQCDCRDQWVGDSGWRSADNVALNPPQPFDGVLPVPPADAPSADVEMIDDRPAAVHVATPTIGNAFPLTR